MLGTLARGAFLIMMAMMIVAWAVSMANSGASQPPYDPNVYYLA
jgi:hypothetical protein